MSVEKLEILSRGPYEEGRRFGDAGAYERLDGVVYYAVDPEDDANQGVVDLASCERDADGLVRFSGDVTLLLPVDAARGNRALLLEMPNRGNRVALRSFNMAPIDLTPTDRIKVGDGFLMSRGWSVAWCGWQWDVPKPAPRLGLTPPLVPPGESAPDAQMQLRIQPDEPTASYPLTDHHVGEIGNHRPVPASDPDDRDATLWVRGFLTDVPVQIPRGQWRFARTDGADVIRDASHVWLRGGFEPGRVYDIVYRPAECPVAGAGLLAARDLAVFLRNSPSAPTAATVDYVIGEGISQCGRFLRTFLGLGLNADEHGDTVFDGLLVHIAGARRGEFNQRYGQPSVQPTPSFGHRFPFADDPQTDPRTNQTAGLLDRQRQAGAVPRILYTDTSSEYWRGDASLSHTDVDTGADVEPPAGVRRYLFAGTQHGPGTLPFTDRSMFGSHGSNTFNVVDYRPLFRAALSNLLAWLADGVEPPPSVFPRASDGTAAVREEVISELEAVSALSVPARDRLLELFPLDLGPDAARGVGRFPARFSGAAYPCIVSAVDEDGNETGGIRMPDVAVPVATHTGFNPRHSTTGGKGQILEYMGSTVPFPATKAQRERTRDPRPSIEERYQSRDVYLEQVRAAACALVQQRYLLEDDIDLCVYLAAERYDACVTSP